MFAIDKDLKDEIRLEKVAKVDDIISTNMDLEALKNKLANEVFSVSINDTPSNDLSNYVYNYSLNRNKKVVLIRIPSKSKISDFNLLVSLFDNLFD